MSILEEGEDYEEKAILTGLDNFWKVVVGMVFKEERAVGDICREMRSWLGGTMLADSRQSYCLLARPNTQQLQAYAAALESAYEG